MATEYISREAAIETLSEFYHHKSEIQHIALREALNRVPTADVVEVVRCRDCVHLCMTGLGTWCFFHPQGSLGHDDFCSAGERRKP